jgi:hypothetical protein
MENAVDEPARRWPSTGDARPYTRWWWLDGPFEDEHITAQLTWFRDHGFGGVEIAWLAPLWSMRPDGERPEWLGEEFRRLLVHTKQACDELGLGCDFTFGSCWPFGGTCVPPELASHTLEGPSGQRVHATWEEPRTGRVLDHLDSRALAHYVSCLGPAFRPALAGSPSALFCDSLELPSEKLWTERLWQEFEGRFGYSLRGRADAVETDAGVRYDHRVLVGETIVREFYAAFTAHCHEMGAVSRVQCHGAPADLLTAYATADVPESETLLFPPAFSRIPASAAALADRTVVSCETFTCIYGFPRGRHLAAAGQAWKDERVEDLKLLADAVFANGVNQIVWHGAPYNGPGGRNEFYASVHVGPDSPLVPHLRAFNGYMDEVSRLLQEGRTHASLAVYLPNEDMIVAGRLPEERCTPGAVSWSEMRDVRLPSGTEGYAPVWVSGAWLADASVEGGVLRVGALRVPALVIDVEWLDDASLRAVLRLARDGLPVAVLRRPRCPGRSPPDGYDERVDELLATAGVDDQLSGLALRPLVEGDDLPWFWARELPDRLRLFFAHPDVREIEYPMPHGLGAASQPQERRVTVHAFGGAHEVTLRFARCGSVVVEVDAAGARCLPLPPWSSG